MSTERSGRNLEDKLYIELVKETARELSDIMKVSMKDRAKDIAKSVLGRSVRTKDPMFWPAGMLMLGLVEAREVLAAGGSDANAGNDSGIDGGSRADSGCVADEETGTGTGTGFGVNDPETKKLVSEIDNCIRAHVSLWGDKYSSKIDYIDDALAGAALVRFWQQTGDEECRKAADVIFKYLMDSPKDSDGVIVYNASRSSNIFADGIGQTAMFLSLYGKAFGVPEALDMAEKQLLGFMKNGMDEKSHLPYHGYGRLEDGSIEKKGVLSWGRAAGWLIMGISEYVKAAGAAATTGDAADMKADDAGEEKLELKKSDIKSLEKENSELLSRWYSELSTALLHYMRPDEGYSWQVQAIDGHLDTSATGMILYGLLNADGILHNLSDGEKTATCDEAAFVDKCRDILRKSVTDGKVGSALSSCDDFGVHYQTYGNYPWGQGAVLAALSLIAESEK
jgi:rhamnogalacturonyl hydrolase YesR